MPATHSGPNGVGPRDAGRAARAGEREGTTENLTVAVGNLRRGVAALKAENRELRAEIAGLEREGTDRRNGDAPIRELGLSDGDSVLVSVYLGTDRLEIQNPGIAGIVAASRAGRESGQGGFGLDLVDVLAARWGGMRDGDTRVWFEMARG